MNGRVDSYNREQKQRAIDAKDIAAAYAQLNKRAHKMGNAKRVVIDGYKFASMDEAQRYKDLRLMEHSGYIRNLRVHPPYPIKVNDVYICRVDADFAYQERQIDFWKEVVEDVKSQRIGKDGKIKFSTDTRHSKIGRKLVLAVHGIEIMLVK